MSYHIQKGSKEREKQMALYQVVDKQKRFQGLEKGEMGEDFFQKFDTKKERKRENLEERIPQFFLKIHIQIRG